MQKLKAQLQQALQLRSVCRKSPFAKNNIQKVFAFAPRECIPPFFKRRWGQGAAPASARGAGNRNKQELPQKKHGFARMRERRAVQARQCFFQEFAPPARTLAASRRLARRLDAADRAGYHKRNRPCRPPQRTTFSPSKSAGGSRKLRFLREFAAARQTSQAERSSPSDELPEDG